MSFYYYTIRRTLKTVCIEVKPFLILLWDPGRDLIICGRKVYCLYVNREALSQVVIMDSHYLRYKDLQFLPYLLGHQPQNLIAYSTGIFCSSVSLKFSTLKSLCRSLCCSRLVSQHAILFLISKKIVQIKRSCRYYLF